MILLPTPIITRLVVVALGGLLALGGIHGITNNKEVKAYKVEKYKPIITRDGFIITDKHWEDAEEDLRIQKLKEEEQIREYDRMMEKQLKEGK